MERATFLPVQWPTDFSVPDHILIMKVDVALTQLGLDYQTAWLND